MFILITKFVQLTEASPLCNNSWSIALGYMKSQLSRRILLVEDEVLIRSFLVEFLTQSGFEVMPCSNTAEALKVFSKFDPDAIISDIDLGPGANGIELVTNLIKAHPHLAAVVLSNYSFPNKEKDPHMKKVAYLRKRDVHDKTILLDALESVLTEKSIDPTEVLENPLSILTGTQLEVLKMMAQGYSNSEIATMRKTSLRSIEQIVHRIFENLNISSDEKINRRVLAVRTYISSSGMPGILA
jgi:DNA-binding NarL/FixJ family response regulator